MFDIQKTLDVAIAAEVERRMKIAQEAHQRAVQEKAEQISRVLRKLMEITVTGYPFEDRISYTTSVDARVLMDNLNDRDFLRYYLAEEIAHKLMSIQPVKQARRPFI